MNSRETYEAYIRLRLWRRKHLPWLAQPAGPLLFFRLVCSREAVATTALYRDAGSSPPTLRKMIDELRRKGLVTVAPDPRDRRRELVEATDSLRQLAHLYVLTMIQLLF